MAAARSFASFAAKERAIYNWRRCKSKFLARFSRFKGSSLSLESFFNDLAFSDFDGTEADEVVLGGIAGGIWGAWREGIGGGLGSGGTEIKILKNQFF